MPAALPESCDVLVVGAGPAGSACARTLAAAGREVLLVDQHDFPRDKVCGDGLIPDAHAALAELGAYDEVMAAARVADHVRVVAPHAGHIDVPGQLAVLPRRELDLILARHAQRAGATLATPFKFEASLVENDRVAGARFAAGGSTHEVRARWVVLATGAAVPPLVAAGVCERRTPSGIALRGYVRHEAMAGRLTGLHLVWHPKLAGGYGWIFPAPGGIFNVGAGLTGSERAMPDVNLRRMLDAFALHYAPAAELMQGGEVVGEFKGAPLRCTLRGARWSRPGLLVTGEAAGSTYSFSGEGIGKALETGIVAAQALLRAGPQAGDDEVRGQHEAGLRALQPRFDLYDRASTVNRHPWLADLVVWRARRSAGILRRMSGVLDETQNPGRLLSARGIVKLLVT